MISYWTSPLARIGVWEAGGMNVYIRELSLILTKMGHEVDIFTRVPDCDEPKVTIVQKGLRVIHLCGPKIKLYDGIKPFAQKILDFIDTENLKYDVIHTHYFYSALVAYELKKINLKVVHNFHSYGSLKEKFYKTLDETRIKIEKEITYKADAIIVSTHSERSEVVDVYKGNPNKTYLIPPGVNHQIFKPVNRQTALAKLNLNPKKIHILFVGRIDPVKGIPTLVKSVGRLIQKQPSLKEKVELLLVGGDVSSQKFWKRPEVIDISNLIKEENLENTVRFLGSRSNTILPYFYSASDVVVLPSIYESFGLVVLEAMSCKAVVVASRSGGPEDLIQDGINGKLFTPGDFTRGNFTIECKGN
jgi:D-inositol-3-phosphate glycosyltransferase